MREWIKQWNRWRKENDCSWIYKLCVLLKLDKSPSLEMKIETERLGKALCVAFVEMGELIDEHTKVVTRWAKEVTKALEETNNIK